MALRGDPDASRYGIVAADETSRVVQLTTVARAAAHGAVDDTTHFTGIHALDRDVLRRVPPGPACIVRTVYRELVPERLVAGVRYDGIWLDAGDPEALLDANLLVLGMLDRSALGLDPFKRAGYALTVDGVEHGDRGLVEGATVTGPAWIGAGAKIGRGARISRCVIGSGAEIDGSAGLDQVVVWDRARVGPGSHRRVTITRRLVR